MISMMPVKKAIGIIPIILMYLFGGGGTAAPASPAPGTPAPQPLYQWETMTAQNKFAAEDGTELMYYSYQLLTLSVANLEELRSGEAAEAERNVENFNGKKCNSAGKLLSHERAKSHNYERKLCLPVTLYEYCSDKSKSVPYSFKKSGNSIFLHSFLQIIMW